MEDPRILATDHFLARVAEHALGSGVELYDRAIEARGDDAIGRAVEHGALEAGGAGQLVRALAHARFQHLGGGFLVVNVG